MHRLLLVLSLCSFLTAGLCLAGEGKVSISYGEFAQFEIVSPQGIRIFIDVQNPSVLSKPAAVDDILLTSHNHPDHLAPGFTGSFPGKQLRARDGEIEAGDVRIKSIASSHTAMENFLPRNGSNYIFIIETAGLKIVHFGDIGQDKLTAAQLKEISGADIALAPFYNEFSNMNMVNKKGFNLMAQVNPKLIIPTDYNEDTAQYALGLWKGSYTDQPAIRVAQQDLSGKTQIVLMGSLGKSCGKKFNLGKTKL